MKKTYFLNIADSVGQKLLQRYFPEASSSEKAQECSHALFIAGRGVEKRGLNQGQMVDFDLILGQEFLAVLKKNEIKFLTIILPSRDEKYLNLIESFNDVKLEVEIIVDSNYQNGLFGVSDWPLNSNVRSVQTMIIPKGLNASSLLDEYFRWMNRFSSNIIQVYKNEDVYDFCLFSPKIKILKLERLTSSNDYFVILKIIGGLLASKKEENGYFEFRSLLQNKLLITDLKNFRPSLPFPLYLMTQAIVHFVVMRLFREHLNWLYLKQDKEKI